MRKGLEKMKIYIDVEATQAQEIISIGVTTDKNKATFYALVKPQFSVLTPTIERLTHISQQDLDDALPFDRVLNDLYHWLHNRCSNMQEWEFYSYGTDEVYFKKTLPNCKNTFCYMFCCQIIATLQDASVSVKHFFKRNVKLQYAYNYIKNQEKAQRHNALEDAMMLQYIMDYIKDNVPFEVSPCEKEEIDCVQNIKGRFICKDITGQILKNACSMEEMVVWLLSLPQYTNLLDFQQPRFSRLANKIAEAAKQKQPYANYYWAKVEI